MSKGKRLRSKRKSKTENEDRHRICEYVVEQNSDKNEGIICEEIALDSGSSAPRHEDQNMSGNVTKNERSSKRVHFAFLPEKYEPLVEDQPDSIQNEDSRRKKQEKHKKFRKNVGKALRYSWKCFVAGLQTFTMGYSTPLSAGTVILPEIYRTKPRA